MYDLECIRCAERSKAFEITWDGMELLDYCLGCLKEIDEDNDPEGEIMVSEVDVVNKTITLTEKP